MSSRRRRVLGATVRSRRMRTKILRRRTRGAGARRAATAAAAAAATMTGGAAVANAEQFPGVAWVESSGGRLAASAVSCGDPRLALRVDAPEPSRCSAPPDERP
jgi:hypothetical protein